jgi:hypothetical protein
MRMFFAIIVRSNHRPEYDLPFGRGKSMLNNGPAAVVLGGWQFNLIAQFRSGQPFNLDVPGDVANIGNSVAWWNYARPNLVGNPYLSHPTEGEWFNRSALLVENVDKVFAKAVKLGATAQGPVSDMFWGDRCGRLVDPEGYAWYIASHISEPTPAEMKRQMIEDMKKWQAQQAQGTPST